MPSHGILFAVVGASGVGKDSLIAYAAVRLADRPDVRFVRRVITRPAESGGEDHDYLPLEQFQARERSGGFAVSWSAHGLRYGIPVSAAGFVESGGLAVLNGSRNALAAIAEAFVDLKVVEITARADVLERRLLGRGRESAAEIASRLERRVQSRPTSWSAAEIDNSGDLAEAGERFVGILEAALDSLRRRDSVPASDGPSSVLC